MATFNLNTTFSERIFINIAETTVANFNIYQVPDGFYAQVVRIQYEGRGQNSVSNPSVGLTVTPNSYLDNNYYTQTTEILITPVTPVGAGTNVNFNGNPGLLVRNYVDGSGFRRIESETLQGFRFEERHRLGHTAPNVFMAFRARLTIELYRYL